MKSHYLCLDWKKFNFDYLTTFPVAFRRNAVFPKVPCLSLRVAFSSLEMSRIEQHPQGLLEVSRSLRV